MLLRLLRRYPFCTNSSQPAQKFVISSRIGGSSQDKCYQIYANAKYINRALQLQKRSILGATILTQPQQCKRCIQKLMKTQTIVAWDTQTIDLDIKQQAPVGNGKIICASFFAGPQYDFGSGSRVFIDNFGANAGLINHFKEYLEDQKYKKVWHNYGFDRHIFYNHGIDVRGFGGDTMHMARLYDASRLPGEYSLASLTKSFKAQMEQKTNTYILTKVQAYKETLKTTTDQSLTKDLLKKIECLENYNRKRVQGSLAKKKLEDIFYRKKVLKSGSQGKVLQFPSILTLHTSGQYIKDWIEYSLLDTESTFFLRELLEQLLFKQKSNAFEGYEDMWKLYQEQWLPFGQALTGMERKGFKINVNHMEKIKVQAQQMLQQKKQEFQQFVCSIQSDPNIHLFNPASSQQMQQLLHAPYKVKNLKVEQSTYDYEQSQLLENVDNQGEPKKPNRKVVVELPQTATFLIANPNYNGNSKVEKAKVQMKVHGLGINPIRLTPKMMPSVDEEALRLLVGNPKEGKYGTAYKHFSEKGEQQLGIKLTEALYKLLQYRNIQTLYNTFIDPLIGYVDQSGRIHCSLNINTETGRLSSRKPNLQNQPALEKDIYKIRKAFVADQGKKLIVADYGQLELRVLAHISNCGNMIRAFQEGGDFHSRTAIGMYDYIKKDMEQGKVLLEWDKSKGAPPVPLIKEKYAAERRKAKTVNFSIAYGKTAKGFAEDWNCSVAEANKVIKAWFGDRKEVKQWQDRMKALARKDKITRTLLGRLRKLDRFSDLKSAEGMMLRRAVNTPIQGGAADIVMAAMVNIHKNTQLRELGWELLLQIHDQLILEGPKESAKQALEIVTKCMAHPFHKDLLIELEVDAKIGDNWYQCK